MLDVWERLPALWTQTSGPQSSRQTSPFIHNHCQKNSRPTRGACWQTSQELWCLIHNFWVIFLWEMPLHVTPQPRSGLFADSSRPEWGSDSRSILIYLFTDECTRSSWTYRAHHSTVKSNQFNGERQRLVRVAVKWSDEFTAETQQPEPSSLFLLTDDSVKLDELWASAPLREAATVASATQWLIPSPPS